MTYETSVATLIQFIISSFFVLFSQIGSSATSCVKDGNDCVTNIITSIIFFILTAIFFGCVWLIGLAAQERRSKRLAQLLICAEGLICLAALFSLKLNVHSHNIIGVIASFGSLVLSVWVISLAFRLMRAGGSRVVNRRRRRPSASE